MHMHVTFKHFLLSHIIYAILTVRDINTLAMPYFLLTQLFFVIVIIHNKTMIAQRNLSEACDINIDPEHVPFL